MEVLHTQLKDVNFTDLWLGASTGWMGGIPGTNDPLPVPQQLQSEVQGLTKLCKSSLIDHPDGDFPLSHCGVDSRVSLMESINEIVFVLRRLAENVPLLGDLNIHKSMVERLMVKDLKGLLIVAGAYGQGKTTTVSSIVKTRLTKLGGVGVTIENPPEMRLQGKHGEGVCFQTWVKKGEFADQCRRAARWAPSIIMLGEVRDAETAIEALRASINGRLIVCTIHADGAIHACERIVTLASGAGGGIEDAAQLLSSGLTGVMHQELIKHGEHKTPMIESLFLDANSSGAANIRTTISTRNFKQLGTFMQAQRNRMFSGVAA